MVLMSVTTWGIMVLMLSIMEVTPLSISSAALSFPAIRSEKPSMMLTRPGSISEVIRFSSPPNVLFSRLKLSSNAALAATASLLMTMP